MDLQASSRTAIVFLVVLLLRVSLASSDECTNGFLNSLINMENYDSRWLGPPLGRYRFSKAEQWIFPSLRFTCPGRLTKWMFRAAPQRVISLQLCSSRINIGTWRLESSTSGIIYRRVSTTEGLLNQHITNDGPIFIYHLPSPVQVQPDDIVGVELKFHCSSSNDTVLQSYRHFVIKSTFNATNFIPFIQPVIETAGVEEPTTESAIHRASNSTENVTTPATDHLTSTQAHEEMISITINDPLSTTTAKFIYTTEPREETIRVVHIVTGVGIGVLALLGTCIVVACIGLVGIVKCMRARSAKGGRSKDMPVLERPQIVVPCSNGTLLQENTAYRKRMNSWSTDTTGYETLSTGGGKNYDTARLQNTSNSDDNVVGYETTLSQEESKHDRTQPQPHDNSRKRGKGENTASKKSTHTSEAMAAYETISTVQDRDTGINQCTSTSGIVVRQNTAYKRSTNSGDRITGYETIDKIEEQVMQLNQAYGFQGESQEGTDSMNTGDYETMTGDSMYDYGCQTHRGVNIKSIPAVSEPVAYNVQTQQQHTITASEDSEHSYDYVI